MALAVMRRHRRWLFGFLWLVIAAFVILYIPAFDQGQAAGPGAVMAEVGGLPITVGEYQKAYLRQREMYQSMYQGRMDPEMLKRLGLEEQVFSALRDERVLTLEAERLGLTVDDESLARRLSNAPELQKDGRFMGAEELRRRLEQQGMRVEEFETRLRADMLREKLVALVTDAVSVGPDEVEREFRRRTEQVKAEYVAVEASRYMPEVNASDAEVKERFESRKDEYRFPERRLVSYVLVDAPTLQSRVALTERDLEVYYQANADEFKEDEQACASHILIKVKADDAGEGHPDAEGRALAEGALAQVKSGADFATVAKALSEDQGSAPGGGDLGCFGRGRMVPQFEDAAYALAPGAISELVRSDFGYHVIKLNSMKASTQAPLAEVKERIRQQLMGQKLRALLEEKSAAVTAGLAQGRTLDEAAKAEGLAVQKSGPLSRGDVKPPLSSPALVARVFELKRGEAEKEPFQLASGYAFVELTEIQAARMPDLPEVQDKVKADVLLAKARARAKEAATQLVTRAQAEDLDRAASGMGMQKKETPALVGRGQPLGDLGSTPALEEAAFTAPLNVVTGPASTATGYGVLRVVEKKAFDSVAFEKEKASVAKSLREEKRQQLFSAYMEEARKRFKVERYPEALRQAQAS